MAKFRGPRLDNRGAKLHYLADDAATAYTELGRGSDFTGPRYTGGTGEGMAFEDGGHGVARPVFVVHDYIHFVKEFSDGTGRHIYVLLTEVDEGALSPNGLPQWTGTYLTLEDPEDIPAIDLADFLALVP
jgi:hypothetical protein